MPNAECRMPNAEGRRRRPPASAGPGTDSGRWLPAPPPECPSRQDGAKRPLGPCGRGSRRRSAGCPLSGRDGRPTCEPSAAHPGGERTTPLTECQPKGEPPRAAAGRPHRPCRRSPRPPPVPAPDHPSCPGPRGRPAVRSVSTREHGCFPGRLHVRRAGDGRNGCPAVSQLALNGRDVRVVSIAWSGSRSPVEPLEQGRVLVPGPGAPGPVQEPVPAPRGAQGRAEEETEAGGPEAGAATHPPPDDLRAGRRVLAWKDARERWHHL